MHITKWNTPTPKGYILYKSNYTTFCERQTYRESKKIGDWEMSRRINKQSTENFPWYHNDTISFCIVHFLKPQNM